MIGTDPGPCIVCGAAHTTCTREVRTSLETVMFPERDRGVVVAVAEEVIVPPLVAEAVQVTLPPGEFTTGTYRGSGTRRRT